MPDATATIVKQGIIVIIATYLGTSTNSIGSSAIVRSASISSVTTIVPISAEIDDPERPITTIAAINGPNSRVMLVPTRLITTSMAPNLRNSAPP